MGARRWSFPTTGRSISMADAAEAEPIQCRVCDAAMAAAAEKVGEVLAN
jgi:hypothetical protein